MIKFSSIIDSVTYDKIKCGQKSVKFFLCDKKRENLSVADIFQLENETQSSFIVQVISIKKSKNLYKLVKNFSLQLLGESDYNSAYENIKKWFSDKDIEKYSVMAVTIEVKMKEINFITSNQGKIKSLENTLNLQKIYVNVIAKDLDIMEPQFDTVHEVSKFKALRAFEILNAPVLVEDGGFAIKELNNFPGVYTKYILKTIGIDGILRLMEGVQDRSAKFISVTTFVDKNGHVFQFEREGGEFEISKVKVDIKSPFAWSELWKIIYLKEYNKNLCELSKEELDLYYGNNGSNGSIQKFVKWYANEIKD